ncbi:MAG: hypothetical protein EAZ73_27400 [Oscillatoriales cyanobacterium]|nr:MAG: hypothetical protein EAZ83_06300 [Oscillatoriales cyanobacterium]TAE93440.1 MAG: hypothetical protein EAZ79_27565 [Oscillatoriales cyanobacterium]TAF15194.1 MAG: hypothetical protein EAZ73_27400 [Oscillatoriales cyanobacterium]TAF28300.1 MAG: hypothetical protein EAZ69_27010 [Oscillatoriales cyanobacterium]
MYGKFVYYNQYSIDLFEGQFIKVMSYAHKSHIWNMGGQKPGFFRKTSFIIHRLAKNPVSLIVMRNSR